MGLKENDLARIRLTQRDSDYYTALTKYWQTHDELHRELWERVDQFMRQLTAWRDLARQQAIADLIWDIYDQTGFIDYVAGMPGDPNAKPTCMRCMTVRQLMKRHHLKDFSNLFALLNGWKKIMMILTRQPHRALAIR